MSVATTIGGLAGRKGRGWHVNPVDPSMRVWSAPQGLVGASREPIDCLPVRFDQGASSSCVAQALALGITCVESMLGMDVDVISRRALYYLLRKKRGLHKVDAGGYISDGVDVVHRYGCASESRFKWSPLLINQAPNAGLVVEGTERRGLKYERIVGVGNKLIAQLDTALQHGPVVFGMPVTQDFMDYKDGVLRTPTVVAKILGGHATLLVKRNPDGTFTGANSYSRKWGLDGLYVIEDEYLAAHGQDFTVLHDWEKVAHAKAA